jgi:hypothetical protein
MKKKIKHSGIVENKDRTIEGIDEKSAKDYIKDKVVHRQIHKLEKVDNELRLLLEDGSTLLIRAVHQGVPIAELDLEMYWIDANFNIDTEEKEIEEARQRIGEMMNQVEQRRNLLNIIKKKFNAEKGAAEKLKAGVEKEQPEFCFMRGKEKIHFSERAWNVATRLKVEEQIKLGGKSLRFHEGNIAWLFDLRKHPVTKEPTIYVTQRRKI